MPDAIANKISNAIAAAVQTPAVHKLSLIHISEPTRLLSLSYSVFCLKKKPNPSTVHYSPISHPNFIT